MTKVDVTPNQKMDAASLGLGEMVERELKVFEKEDLKESNDSEENEEKSEGDEEDKESEDGKEENSK